MITDDDRRELYEAARRELGERPAATLMVLMSAMDPDRVATKEDLASLRVELRGEIGELRGELTELRGAMQLDNARQTRQLTLTVLAAFLAQFVAMVGVVATVT